MGLRQPKQNFRFEFHQNKFNFIYLFINFIFIQKIEMFELMNDYTIQYGKGIN